MNLMSSSLFSAQNQHIIEIDFVPKMQDHSHSLLMPISSLIKFGDVSTFLATSVTDCALESDTRLSAHNSNHFSGENSNFLGRNTQNI
jgi:hypothetical protein